MSEQTTHTPKPPIPGLITVPVLHGRLEFAVAVRQAIEAVRPRCIAVELPETLEQFVFRGVERLPLLSVIHYLSSNHRPVYLPIEPADPLAEAVRCGLEQGIEVRCIDQDTDTYGRHDEPVPDPYAVKSVGHQRYIDAFSPFLDRVEPDPADENREATMAFHLRALLAEHDSVLFVCGLFHARRVEDLLRGPDRGQPLRRVRRDKVTLYHLSQKSSKEVMAEPPFLSGSYEASRSGGVAAMEALDRVTEQLSLAKKARENHKKNSGDEVSSSALSVLFRFARNYALVEGRLCADLFQLLVAARGAVDDNYGFEVFDLATDYPHQTDKPELPVIDLTIEDLYENARYIRFHRTQKTRRRGMLRLVKPRKKEERPGDWKKQFRGDAICSYQPEDLIIESYGDFLKKKAKGVLSAEQSRVEPFSASLLDGIDVRETLRNWHEGRLYVKEHRLVRGDVGSVVVILDEDRGEAERFPWCLTWQGENDQESDMAFYATEAGEMMVGPGISRCQYGGFLLTYPPGRMFAVWQDPYFEAARTKAERLLMAAIDYSVHRLVVYVAEKPPRSKIKAVAERFGRKVVYLPLTDLSPVTLKQVRSFHVLDGHPVRAWANEYIR